MKYVKINLEGRIVEIIQEYEKEFPNIPLSDRYTQEFIDKLISVPDDVLITSDMLYSYEDGKFYTPEEKPNLRSKIKDIESINDSLSSQTTDIQMALCESYENSENQLTDIQMALCEVYELLQGGTT